MARKLTGTLQFTIDFTALEQLAAAGLAMGNTVKKDKQYQDDIMAVAHGVAEQDFNMEAAAYAAAGGKIKHMFEWGTAGINRGRTEIRPSPLSERARLWKTELLGHGLNKEMTYTFKPSVAYVPFPTKRDTGMDPEVIGSLRKHYFWNKAMVLETGSTVTIMPKNSKYLLIPYYGSQHGSAMFTDYDIERGFTLSKGPHTHSPGDTGGTTGQFTTFWTGFWEGRGSKIMDKNLQNQIETDFFPRTSARSGRRRVPPTPGQFKARVAAMEKKVAREAKAKARGRVV